MAYNEHLADRINGILKEKNANFYEKKMFGGLCFMVEEKMCIGIVKEEIMARIGEDKYTEALLKHGCREMNFTGQPMKGYVFIDEASIDLDDDLEYWVQLALDFNPFAKSSKKRIKQ
jgi:TfoX/Sxy family transcriptional regulator of competence genes